MQLSKYAVVTIGTFRICLLCICFVCVVFVEAAENGSSAPNVCKDRSSGPPLFNIIRPKVQNVIFVVLMRVCGFVYGGRCRERWPLFLCECVGWWSELSPPDPYVRAARR